MYIYIKKRFINISLKNTIQYILKKKKNIEIVKMVSFMGHLIEKLV